MDVAHLIAASLSRQVIDADLAMVAKILGALGMLPSFRLEGRAPDGGTGT